MSNMTATEELSFIDVVEKAGEARG